jgi:hypothetical protein
MVLGRERVCMGVSFGWQGWSGSRQGKTARAPGEIQYIKPAFLLCV